MLSPEVTASLAELLVAAISLVLTITLPIITARIYRWTGGRIEEKHMRALHSAALTGVRLAIESGLDGPRMRDAAIAYMRESVPDAIRAQVGSDIPVGGPLQWGHARRQMAVFVAQHA